MISPDDIQAKFQSLVESTGSYRNAVREMYGNQGIGLRWLWPAVAIHVGVERKEAMRLTLEATRELRDEQRVTNRSAENPDHCPRCNSPLFHAIPGVTTPTEIRDFYSTVALYSKRPAPDEDWIHPGIHCPRGCVMITHHFSHGTNERWKKLNEERLKQETCRVHVTAAPGLPRELKRYKVYLNGNSLSSRPEDGAAKDALLARVEPGRHRLFARQTKIGYLGSIIHHDDLPELESNGIEFTLTAEEEARFELDQRGEQLQLRLLDQKA